MKVLSFQRSPFSAQLKKFGRQNFSSAGRKTFSIGILWKTHMNAIGNSRSKSFGRKEVLYNPSQENANCRAVKSLRKRRVIACYIVFSCFTVHILYCTQLTWFRGDQDDKDGGHRQRRHICADGSKKAPIDLFPRFVVKWRRGPKCEDALYLWVLLPWECCVPCWDFCVIFPMGAECK